MGKNTGHGVEFLLRTERRDGTDRYTLIDVERNCLVIQTTNRQIIDWCLSYGVRQIVPHTPLNVNSRQRSLR